MDVLDDILGSLRLSGGVVIDGEFTGDYCVRAQFTPHHSGPPSDSAPSANADPECGAARGAMARLLAPLPARGQSDAGSGGPAVRAVPGPGDPRLRRASPGGLGRVAARARRSGGGSRAIDDP